MHLNGKNYYKVIQREKTLQQMTKIFEEKKIDHRGLSAPVRGMIHAHDHYFQSFSSLKLLDQSKPNCMWSLLGKGGGNYINGPGHMTKMATMPIYG